MRIVIKIITKILLVQIVIVVIIMVQQSNNLERGLDKCSIRLSMASRNNEIPLEDRFADFLLIFTNQLKTILIEEFSN